MQYRLQGSINSAQGPALSGVEVYICNQPATTSEIPPAPLATLYTDATGATPLANPVLTDGLGNWFCYTAIGTYTVVWYDPLNRIQQMNFPDQQVTSQGGGSVTSVGLQGDGVVFAPAVPGSPVTSSGTLAPALNAVSPNLVLAGPAAGAAATPTYRALVAADIPIGAGSVTSVNLSVTTSSLLSASVSGSPITSSGTISLTITFATQAANTFLAGPASGAIGNITARNQVPADAPPQQVVAFTPTPIFNAAIYGSFQMTLTGNVILSTLNGAGGRITFIIAQDATGGRTFAWPSNVLGYSQIGSNANEVSVQDFIWDSVSNAWRATSAGSVNQT